ncbi:MAG: TonB-dependent receptor [Bacteroidota bacterium]
MLHGSLSPARALWLVLLLLAPLTAWAQRTSGEVVGQVTEPDGSPIPGATILVTDQNYGTAADADGRYELFLPEDTWSITVSAVGFASVTDSVTVTRREVTRYDVVLSPTDATLGTVEVEAERTREAGVSSIDAEMIQDMPMPVMDGLRAVKVLLGVVSNNETSNEFSVRGGGFNENLYYVNGFEIFKPLRTRQGEQEGLGLVNPDLADRLTLFAGGFPARFGGKLSSALDVGYNLPDENGFVGTAYTSTLDAGGAVRGRMGKLGASVGVRTARAARFFASQALEGEYDPEFNDVQALVGYDLAPGHRVEALGMVAQHRFSLDPENRVSNFGIFPEIRSVREQFSGQEEDGYDIAFGGVRLQNRLSRRLRIEHQLAYFDLEEFETFDVTSGVEIRQIIDPNLDPDDPANLLQLGSAEERDFADNRIGFTSLTGAGRYGLALDRHALEVGWQARRLEFRDQLFEFKQIFDTDNETGEPFAVPFDSVNATARFDETQLGFYVQDAVDLLARPGDLVATVGVRADYFSFNEEWTVSPRLSVLYRHSPELTYTAAAGIYYQQPTYRELRGDVTSDSEFATAFNRDIRSQRSILLVAGVERFLPRRRLYVRAEAYYKHLTDLISYTVENTRVTYAGTNDADGYALGLDLQIRGEIVPGVESWVNYGFLTTRETFNDVAGLDTGIVGQVALGEGVARPFDRRHNVTLFVQDYVPGDDSWKLHMRALFGTGLPYTPPVPDPEAPESEVARIPGDRHSARFPSYQRIDLGATKQLMLTNPGANRPVALKLTVEVLNVFNFRNTIAYSWQGFQWNRVPTRLTPRTVNARLRVNF